MDYALKRTELGHVWISRYMRTDKVVEDIEPGGNKSDYEDQNES